MLNKNFCYNYDKNYHGCRQYYLCLFGIVIAWNKEINSKDKKFSFPVYVIKSSVFYIYGWNFIITRIKTLRKYHGIEED